MIGEDPGVAGVRRSQERALPAEPVSKLFDEVEIAARVQALAGEIVRAMATSSW